MSDDTDKITDVLNNLRTRSVTNADAIRKLEDARCLMFHQEAEDQKAECKPDPVTMDEAMLEQARDIWYRVKPYQYDIGGRGGTSYIIEECRQMATSKDKKKADELVFRLNCLKKLERENRRLREEAEAYKGHHFKAIREAMTREIEYTGLGRWSGERKKLADFGRAVLVRLGGTKSRSTLD